MFVIRDSVYARFQRDSEEQYQAEMTDYVRRVFPELDGRVEDAELRGVVTQQTRRAAGYGLRLKSDVARYIVVSLVLGPDFDRDPRFPWAGAALHDGKHTPTTRMNLLYSATKEFLEAGGRPDADGLNRGGARP